MLEYYEQGRWVTESRDKILEDLIQKCGLFILKKFYRQNKSEIHDEINVEQDGWTACQIRQAIERWLDKIENEDVKLFKEMKKYIIYCIIRNKSIPKE